MRRIVVGTAALAACLAALTASAPVESCGYGMPSPLRRFLVAECVVAGRVIGFEDLNVFALPHATAPKDLEYKVAVVSVTHAFKGAREKDLVRVGLFPTQGLRGGQEVLLFLNRHFEEPFFVTRNPYEYGIGKDNNPDYDRQLAQYGRWAKAWNDPVAALTSGDPVERLHAAILQVERHCFFQPGLHEPLAKKQPLDAERGRLILRALAGADWGKGGPDFRMTPWRAFSLLRATTNDGWRPEAGRNMQQIQSAACQWVGENAETFRIQAFVEK